MKVIFKYPMNIIIITYEIKYIFENESYIFI